MWSTHRYMYLAARCHLGSIAFGRCLGDRSPCLLAIIMASDPWSTLVATAPALDAQQTKQGMGFRLHGVVIFCFLVPPCLNAAEGYCCQVLKRWAVLSRMIPVRQPIASWQFQMEVLPRPTSSTSTEYLPVAK